jgi:Flp pilus assembly pilin Flp
VSVKVLHRLATPRARSLPQSSFHRSIRLQYQGWIMKRFKNFVRSDDAIAVTEYGLLVALIAIALIAVVTVFGNQIASWFERKTGQITTV